MFNVDRDACGSTVKVASKPVKQNDKLIGKVNNPNATVAFIVPWGDMAAGRFLTQALQMGLTVKSADKSFQLDNGKSYPAGSLVLEHRTNTKKLNTQVAKLAETTGALVDGVGSSWVVKGPSFGSGYTVTMKAPKVAIAWDEPTSSLSAGNTRFVIEQQFDYPVTAIRTKHLARGDLSNYQVIILPNGFYQSALGKAGAKNLNDWVKSGGVLITFSGATRFAAGKDIGLLDVKRENAFKDKKGKKGKSDNKKSTVDGTLYTKQSDLVDASENDEDRPSFVAGVLANVEVDQEHWLTAGVNKDVVGMVLGSDIYAPIKLKSGKNVAWFKGADEVLASGYLWQENKKQLAYKPFLIHQPKGKGMVIAYTQEPTMRAYLDGLNVMLMNSIFRAAAHAR